MANSSDGKVAELNEEKENLLNLIDELKLASQKATHEFKELSEKLEMENKDKQQKVEEIKTLENQLKEKDEVIETFTKGKDNLEALLGAKMKSISHRLGFNKQKSKKDKSGEKKDKAPLIIFVKGPSLENTEIKQTLNKTTTIPKTQNKKKSTRSTQLPDRSTPVHKKKDLVTAMSTPVKERSTCSTSINTNHKTKNSNKNLKNIKKSKDELEDIGENLNIQSPSSSGSGNVVPDVSTPQQARSTLPQSRVDTLLPRSTLTSSSVDTYPCQGDSSRGCRLGSSCSCGALHLRNPFLYAGRPHGRLPPLNTATIPPSSLLQPILVLLPFILSSPSSAISLSLASMAHKQAPRHGARSRATARPIPAEEAPPTERRSKRRYDPAEQPGPSSASPSSAKRGRTSSVRGRGSANPRRRILVSSPDISEESSSSSSEATPSKPVSEGKMILKPRAVDLADTQLAAAFPEIHSFFSFQTWLPFISEFRIIYPRLVQEFYMNLECTDDGYKSEVKGIVIDFPTELTATLFKIPDEGADYHNFEFNLHEAYTILTGLQADESDPKQTHVTKFKTNTFPPILRLIHHILTTIITPQGGDRDRLTDIQRFVIYCMKKDIKVNLHVIMYQIMSETTRADLHRSLPYAAHLTQVFKHFGVSLENEKCQKIPKSNIYCFKHVQKFMGFRLEGDQVRRGPAVVEAPVALEDQPPAEADQPPANEDQPPTNEDQPPAYEDQPHVENEVDMSEAFELRVQRLENTVSAQFIKQKEASDYAAQRFNRLIGTLADASLDLKEHQDKLEKVLEGILENFQQNLFNIQEAVNQISKTRLSFAHMVDDLEGMKNLSAHIDEEMSNLKKEFKTLHRHGGTASSSSSSQPISADLSVLQATMSTPDAVRSTPDAVRSTPNADRSTLDASPRRPVLPDWDKVSTLDHLRSTLETSPRELFCLSGTVCRHTLWAGRHTLETL
ncbi:hypothetical protein Taro_013568 [Colocasia esculenta]|uniref:Putative plant transposon protein domain-containing protein n=1 Tax=Colocasia esculenta TaxID=4460 RepID=A0A843UMJ5_COLES|nr:hypothetical protein [Colocasia esculenta]